MCMKNKNWNSYSRGCSDVISCNSIFNEQYDESLARNNWASLLFRATALVFYIVGLWFKHSQRHFFDIYIGDPEKKHITFTTEGSTKTNSLQ